MEALKVGVIGCGAIGREHIKRLQHRLTDVTVTAVTDVNSAFAQQGADLAGAHCQVFADAQALVNASDVDAVVVTTPGFAHKDAVLMAIQAGKPVFCEKPLATTAADCMAIVEAEQAAGRPLTQVGFMRRYDQGYVQMKQLLDAGSFGQPLLVKCTHRAIGVDDSYSTEMAVTDTAIHEIDCLHWLLDDQWKTAQVITGAKTQYAHDKLVDPQLMILQSERGITVALEVFVNCRFGYDINCEVVCENGEIALPTPAFPVVRQDGRCSMAIEQDWVHRFIDSYDVELQAWVKDTLAGTVTGPTAWDGYMASVTADALVKAQQTGAIEPIVFAEKPDLYA